MAGLRQRSKLELILPAVVNKPVTDGLFPAEYVYLSLLEGEEVKFPATDFFLRIAATGAAMEQPAFAGGGGATMPFRCDLEITLWARLGVDQPYRDDALWLDPALGMLPKWSAVLRSYVADHAAGFDPVNAQGDFLMGEPMRPVHVDYLPRRQGDGWARLSSRWYFVWAQDLT
jgi:hypothetical protein